MPTNYTLDINPSTLLRTGTGLTQVLADGTNTYLYGQGRIAQEGAAVEYFLGDALSSVRQLTDSGGVVNLAQSYQPYGEVLNSGGESSSPYGFTGEYLDSYIKLMFLRSRYMSTDTGRFTTKDVWDGETHRPLSLNWVSPIFVRKYTVEIPPFPFCACQSSSNFAS